MSTDTNTGPDPDGTGTGAPAAADAPNGPPGGTGTPEGAEGVSAPAADQNGAAAGTGTGDDDTPNGEASRYRRRLRDTERERDQLRERITTMQNTEVSRVAAGTLAEGSDLLALSGTTLADLLDDSGDVDPDAVRTAAETLVRARPGLRRPPTGAEIRSGIGQGSGPAPRAARSGGSGGGWADALRGS